MDIQTLNKIGDSLRMLRARLSAEVAMAERQSDAETARELRAELIDVQQQLLAVTAEVKAAQFHSENVEMISMDVASVNFQTHGVTVQLLGQRCTAFYRHETGALTVNV